MKARIPNLVELGRSPNPLRYVWLLVGPTVHAGTTWMGLNRSYKKHPDAHLMVLRLKLKEIIECTPEEFLEKWRPHYFDPNWMFVRTRALYHSLPLSYTEGENRVDK